MIHLSLFAFLGILYLLKGKQTYIDLFPIILVFFDITVRFSSSQWANYAYLQRGLTIMYIAFYYIKYWPAMRRMSQQVIIFIVLYLVAIVLFPMFKGVTIIDSIKSFSLTASTMLIFPMAYHYYSNNGNINNLYRWLCITTIILMISVIVFSVFKIDSLHRIHETVDLGSKSFGIGIIYYGQMGQRGLLIYLWLFILMYPLIVRYVEGMLKVVYFISIFFLVSIMFISLKRATLILVTLGLINFFIKSKVKLQTVILTGAVFLLLFGALAYYTPYLDFVTASYYKRGEKRFQAEYVREDVRFFEPIYIFESSMHAGFSGFLFGTQTDRYFDIDSERHSITQRDIHNEYGKQLLYYGFLGLFFYLFIYFSIYIKGRNNYGLIREVDEAYKTEWITFQNIVILFLFEGTTGQHSLLTYRSLVFLISGALCGVFYVNGKKIENSGVA